MEVSKISLALLGIMVSSVVCESFHNSDNEHIVSNAHVDDQQEYSNYHDVHHQSTKRSTSESEGSYGYNDDIYREKSGGYGGSDAYSTKAGYGQPQTYGHSASGGYGSGSSGSGSGNILHILTSLGVLLSLLLAGTALGAAMFGPFTGSAGMSSGIPTVPGGRKFESRAGIGATGELLLNTRAKFLDYLGTVFDKYHIENVECQKKFVCEMFKKIKQRQPVEDIVSEPERRTMKDDKKDAFLQAAMDGSSGLDCSSLYKGCDHELKDALNQWQNNLD